MKRQFSLMWEKVITIKKRSSYKTQDFFKKIFYKSSRLSLFWGFPRTYWHVHHKG